MANKELTALSELLWLFCVFIFLVQEPISVLKSIKEEILLKIFPMSLYFIYFVIGVEDINIFVGIFSGVDMYVALAVCYCFLDEFSLSKIYLFCFGKCLIMTSKVSLCDIQILMIFKRIKKISISSPKCPN